MSIIRKVAFAAAVVFAFAYCGSSSPSRSDKAVVADIDLGAAEENPATEFKEPAAPLSSTAAQHDASDTLHRFVRTADVRCRVNNVVQATYAIEAIVRAHHGYVEHTGLRSVEERKESVRVTRDSLLERAWVSVHNDLRIRVPNTELDSTLIAIAPLIDFLDRRDINADDVRLELLANDLEQRRLARHRQRVENAVDEQGRRLKETTPVEDRLLERQGQSDAAMLANMRTNDRIAFSTLTFDLYQRETLHSAMLAAPPPVATFTEPLGLRALSSLRAGWSVLMDLLLFLLKVWPLWLIGGVVLLVLRRLKPSLR